jgi:hypothetical protein
MKNTDASLVTIMKIESIINDILTYNEEDIKTNISTYQYNALEYKKAKVASITSILFKKMTINLNNLINYFKSIRQIDSSIDEKVLIISTVNKTYKKLHKSAGDRTRGFMTLINPFGLLELELDEASTYIIKHLKEGKSIQEIINDLSELLIVFNRYIMPINEVLNYVIKVIINMEFKENTSSNDKGLSKARDTILTYLNNLDQSISILKDE